MDFRELRENLLKISIDAFSSEYGLRVEDVRKMDVTNEVPLSLINRISKKTGHSVGYLLSYDSSVTHIETIENKKDTQEEKSLSAFSIPKDNSVVSQFRIWLRDNNDALVISNGIEEWIEHNIVPVLEKYEKALKADASAQDLVRIEVDVCKNTEELCVDLHKEINRLQYIIENKTSCQATVKKVLDFVVISLIEEENILNSTIQDLDIEKRKKLNEISALLKHMTSTKSIEEAMKRNVIEEYLLSEIIDDIKKTCSNSQFEFRKAIESIVFRDGGVLNSLNKYLTSAFSQTPELNGFSCEGIYNDYFNETFKKGFSKPELLDVDFTNISKEKKDASKYFLISKKIWDIWMDGPIEKLSPSYYIKQINKVTGVNDRYTANQIAQVFKEGKLVDENYVKIERYYDLIVKSSKYALNGVKKEWIKYLNITIDYVIMDDIDLKQLLIDDRKKMLVVKSLNEAFKEV